jgi:hypothetical protein
VESLGICPEELKKIEINPEIVECGLKFSATIE